MLESYTTFQISQKLGIKYPRLREWIDRRYVRPSIHRAKRQGEKTLFSRIDIYGIKFFESLLENGFSREVAAQTSEAFLSAEDGLKKELLESKLVVCYLQRDVEVPLVAWTSKSEVTITLAGRTVGGERGECDGALVVNFKKIRDYVDQALR